MKGVKISLFGCCAALILLTSGIQNFAQPTLSVQSAQGEPLTLQHADSLVGSMTPQGFIRELIGNVALMQNTATVTCQKAIHYMALNKAELMGNVILTQNTVTMKAPHGVYDGITRTIFGNQGVWLQDRKYTLTAREGVYSTETKIARFYQQVVIESDSLIIYADELEYHRETQNSYATGSVAVVGKFTNVYLQGDSLVHIPQRQYTRVSLVFPSTIASIQRSTTPTLNRQPMVSQIDTVLLDSKQKQDLAQQKPQALPKKNVQSKHTRTLETVDTTTAQQFRLDTLCIVGNVLEAFRAENQELYLATGNVRLTRGRGSSSFAAKSEKAEYDKRNNIISMYTDPVLWLDSTQIRGDSLTITIRDKRLEHVIARHNALAATKADTTFPQRIDQLSGEEIVIHSERDTLRTIAAFGKAFNVYFLYSNEKRDSLQKKVPDGAARNAADSIMIVFEQGEPSSIIWLGKVEGEAIPEHFVEKKISDIYLKGFAWFTNRPKLQRLPRVQEIEKLKPSAKTLQVKRKKQ